MLAKYSPDRCVRKEHVSGEGLLRVNQKFSFFGRSTQKVSLIALKTGGLLGFKLGPKRSSQLGWAFAKAVPRVFSATCGERTGVEFGPFDRQGVTLWEPP